MHKGQVPIWSVVLLTSIITTGGAKLADYFFGAPAQSSQAIAAAQTHIGEVNAASDKANAVQDVKIESLSKDITEIKADVKEMKQLLYESLGYNKPAVKAVLNAPLINAKDTSLNIGHD